MQAVTIRQPQATAVLSRPGPIKLLLWRTDYRGVLLIHADRRGAGDPLPGPDGKPIYNALLGIVELVDCVEADGTDSDADEAGHIWVLANPRQFTHPIAHPGRGVGLFSVADELIEGARTRTPPAPRKEAVAKPSRAAPKRRKKVSKDA
jgi:hypothetical protein